MFGFLLIVAAIVFIVFVSRRKSGISHPGAPRGAHGSTPFFFGGADSGSSDSHRHGHHDSGTSHHPGHHHGHHDSSATGHHDSGGHDAGSAGFDGGGSDAGGGGDGGGGSGGGD